MLTRVNAAAGTIVDVLLRPFEAHPLPGLLVGSAIGAVLVLGAFKIAGRPARMTMLKRRMRAGLFELRLFRDDPRLVLRVAAGLLRDQAAYLAAMLVPLAVLALPMTLLLGQLDARYGYDGLRPGEPALVTARFADAASLDGHKPALTLEAPDGLVLETPGVWVPARGEMTWRIAASREGDYEIHLYGPGPPIAKRIRVSAATVPRSPARVAPSLSAELLHPVEPPLPSDSPIGSVEVTYPPRRFDLLGASVSWLAIFLVASTALAIAGRPLFGVVF